MARRIELKDANCISRDDQFPRTQVALMMVQFSSIFERASSEELIQNC